jgi:pterin-4a-carbinolamine dehydratase
MSLTSIQALRSPCRLASSPRFLSLLHSSAPKPYRIPSHHLRAISDDSKSRFSESPPLSGSSPAVPSRVRGWPSPWLSERDFKEYVLPLYKKEWYISFSSRHGSGFTAATGLRMASTRLTKIYYFKDLDSTLAFLSKVSELSKSEKHDISFIYEPRGTKGSAITVSVGTHSGKRPDWLEEGSCPELIGITEVPGITHRDVRFAIFMDEAFASHHPQYPSPPFSKSLQRQQLAWREFVYRTREKLGYKICSHCSGKHDISVVEYCPNRYIGPPEPSQSATAEPCIHCESTEHWSVDCPKMVMQGKENCDYCQSIGRRVDPLGDRHTILDCSHMKSKMMETTEPKRGVRSRAR